jgi:cellulose synthase operon protein C
MSVRWKPLVILTGLFAVVAMLGLVAMAFVLAPRTSALQLARSERTAHNYPRAEIHYRQALQKEPKNARLLLETAEFYDEWAEGVAADRVKHRLFRLKYLADAAKYGKQLVEPPRLLLAEALRQADGVEALRWAAVLLALEPQNADAHYVLAEEALGASPPNIDEAKQHLSALESSEPRRPRTEWLCARQAQANQDDAALEEILTRARSATLKADADPLDRLSLIRLRSLDAQRTRDPAILAERVEAFRAEAGRLAALGSLAVARVAQLGVELQKVEKYLGGVAAEANPQAKARATELADSIDTVAETTFKNAIASNGAPDLRIYQAYAEHLLARDKRKECLAVIAQALKLPMASMPALYEPLMNLREVAIRAALSDPQDPRRFELAEPFLKELVQSKHAHYEGLGHLFQGAISLEQSGLASGAPVGLGDEVSPQQAKLRDLALGHLQRAAEQLPHVAAAQALYGVCLILAQEPALGRQYLARAQKLGNLEPRYQVWAAWSIVQAGYPEDAEPIVKRLLDQVQSGAVPRELERTLHLLAGEIHQARRDPAELSKALAEFQQGFASGQPISPDVALRMVQIEVMLGHPEKGLERLNTLRASGQGGAAAERLAVLMQLERNQENEAKRVLAIARNRFPNNSELVALEVALLVRSKQPAQADQVLTEFLAKNPANLPMTQLRARLLSEQLKRFDEARALLNQLAERSQHSGPLVQMALLDLQQRDFDAARRTIAKIRGRWKEAAAADQLEAQLALAQGDMKAAAAHYEDALKKDPANKVVLLAKAELDLQIGATAEGARALEAIARDRPVKEIDPGLTLTTAAQSALAAQALETGDYEGAIHRLEDLLQSGNVGTMARAARWQLVAARAGKGDWSDARREIAALLNDPANPATLDERVRAAQFYRQHNEPDAARAQLDYVLKQNPANAQGVVTRAYMLATAQPPQTAEAVAQVRKAIAASADPPAVLYMVLAALENAAPPVADGLPRALAALDQGLRKYPDSPELVQAKYRVVRMLQGPKAALAVVEAKAQADPKGPFRRLLAEVYRDEQEYARSEAIVAALLQENPTDRALAEELARLLAAQAIQAADRGDRASEKALNDRTALLIREFRKRFPSELSFPQAECELALRKGDLARGLVIANEADALDPHSPVAPLLRARIYSAQGRTSEVAKALRAALDRNPRQQSVRIWLAQACLALDQPAQALAEANRVLESSPDSAVAVVTKARALVFLPDQKTAHEDEALRLLAELLQKQPKVSEAYHLTAEIQRVRKLRAEAVATLKAALQAVPDDSSGLALLVQFLAEPRGKGQPSVAASVQEAKALADRYGGPDQNGQLCMAIAMGFQRAGQIELALPWAEKAAAQRKTPSAHLDYGSLLLAAAEAASDPKAVRAGVERALQEYDLVLKAEPNSVEAVNNKAWILSRYLGKHQAALELAEGLVRSADRASLPGEFFDTLGAIEEALGKLKEAEQAYTEGLRKAPAQPVLNFHMGRLLAADPRRLEEAREHIEKSLASADRLSASTLSEAEGLLKKLGR